ncbi:fibroblast growth factor receptor-like 1 isoform X2 [Diadema antillarum]|uniref:fibroblast growth factor receptor-like 1 isoform X2 n=1 Tax=Diadema antillarum TaxID=105358 RepID=UPI003A8969D9
MARVSSPLFSCLVLWLGVFLHVAAPESSRGPPRVTQEVEKVRRGTLGRSIKLPCPVTGNPPPLTMWTKDGVTINQGWDRFRLRLEGLRISNLVEEDEGAYVCRATNGFGSVSIEFVLTVRERSSDPDPETEVEEPEVDEGVDRPTAGNKINKKPDLVGEHPVNTTVEFGGTTSFQCRVRSDMTPHIQWLKQVPSGASAKHANATIQMNGQYFVVLPAGDVLVRPDGSYLNKLMISYATAEDAGMYICLGANTMGYSFKSAFLEVLPDPNLNMVDPSQHQTPRSHHINQGSWGQTEQGLLIGIPVGLALVFVVAVIVCMVSRNKAGERRRTPPPPPQLPNHHVAKKDYGREYLHHASLSSHHHPHGLDIEQCAPLTGGPQCPPIASQQTLHIYPVPSRENALNRYQDVHSPSSFSDTMKSNNSLTSSRANMHHHLHQHTILHC